MSQQPPQHAEQPQEPAQEPSHGRVPAAGPEPLDVRAATVADAEAVAALVHAAYRSEESRRGWTTEADLVGGQRADAGMIRHVVGLADDVVLVAVGAGGEPFACCHLERRDGAAYLGMFAVRPGLQGRGVGRAMLAAAEAYARDRWGAATVAITVLNHRPELLAWYERCGFRRTGETHPFPYGDDRFGVPRRPDLALLGMVKPVDPALDQPAQDQPAQDQPAR